MEPTKMIIIKDDTGYYVSKPNGVVVSSGNSPEEAVANRWADIEGKTVEHLLGEVIMADPGAFDLEITESANPENVGN
jgi:hypothetical protein